MSKLTLSNKISIYIVIFSTTIILFPFLYFEPIIKDKLYSIEKEKALIIAKTIEPLVSLNYYLDLVTNIDNILQKSMNNENIAEIRVFVEKNLISIKKSNILHKEIMDISYPLYDTLTKEVIGTIEISYSHKNYNDIVDEMENYIYKVVFALIFIFIIFSILIRHLLKPLRIIALRVKNIEPNIKVSFNDLSKEPEINSITKALEIMQDRNIEYTKKLNEHKELLKIRIKEEVAKNVQKEHIMMQQSKFALMGEMIGNIAHQWRQPLNALGILTQRLNFDYRKGRLDAKMLENITTRSMKLINQMSSTIDDFRNFFKPNKLKVNFDISNIILKSTEIVEASFKNHNIKIHFKKDMIEYNGYPNELSQVILNLLNNAKDVIIENSIKNGEINIKIEIEKNINIYVMDNGGGVKDDIIDRIFDPYFTTKEEGGGTGIGLYMSKMIIESHMNGKISVYNNEKGAIFKIALPKGEKDE